MSPEHLFAQGSDRIRLRFVLEDWTELPAPDTEAWSTLLALLRPVCHFAQLRLHEAQHDSVDLYLLLEVGGAPLHCADLAGQLRGQLQDPGWQPYFDRERFAWVGGYHALSVRPGDTLDTDTLERWGAAEASVFGALPRSRVGTALARGAHAGSGGSGVRGGVCASGVRAGVTGSISSAGFRIRGMKRRGRRLSLIRVCVFPAIGA